MRFIYLGLLIVPVLGWLYGHICEKNKNSYPNVSKGYKTVHVCKNALTWRQGNEMMGKAFKVSSSMLMMFNLMFFFLDVKNYMFVLLLNIGMMSLTYFASSQKVKNTLTQR